MYKKETRKSRKEGKKKPIIVCRQHKTNKIYYEKKKRIEGRRRKNAKRKITSPMQLARRETETSKRNSGRNAKRRKERG